MNPALLAWVKVELAWTAMQHTQYRLVSRKSINFSVLSVTVTVPRKIVVYGTVAYPRHILYYLWLNPEYHVDIPAIWWFVHEAPCWKPSPTTPTQFRLLSFQELRIQSESFRIISVPVFLQKDEVKKKTTIMQSQWHFQTFTLFIAPCSFQSWQPYRFLKIWSSSFSPP